MGGQRSGAAATGILLVVLIAPAAAQTIEVAPVGGYRFAGDLFEVAAGGTNDRDGAPTVGASVDVEIDPGLWFEALFTRQEARVVVPHGAFAPSTSERIVVDQWQAGGRQEFGRGRARPFLTGLLGLTRFGSEGDDEVRFTVGAGGGVKLSLQRRLGVRLDGRLFTTFVDVDARAGACAAGGCVVAVRASVVWQAEFTAGLFVGF